MPELAELDGVVQAFLEQTHIPGAALAVVKDNRLVYARGFGLADRELKTPMMPDTLMRIGSISKSITAIAVLKLVERGRLDLDATIVPLLGPRIIDPSTLADPRWNRITVRHLLNHSGGWDAESTFDALVPPPEILAQWGIALPIRKPLTIDHIVREMAKQPLQFDPGTRYSYSNLGFAILSRIVEIASGAPYGRFVQREILEPIGIQRMQLASGKRSGRLLGEASYYDSPDATLLPAVYPDTPDPVSTPDGGYYMEILQGAGGWVGSAIDLVRFAVAVDGGLPAQLLHPSTRRLWTAPPSFALAASDYYALGVVVDKNGDFEEWWHNGAIEGSESYLQGGTASGVRFAFIVNGWPNYGSEADIVALQNFRNALRRVTQWPQDDRFEEFYSDHSPVLAANGVAISASAIQGRAVAGGYASLFGNNLAGKGLSVTFDGLPAPVVFASRNQVNVIAPVALASRTGARVELRRRHAPPVSVLVDIPAVQPSLFTVSGNGQGPAVALNENGSMNSEQNAARVGSTITIFATGLGEFTKAWPENAPAPRGAELQTKPSVFLNDRAADLVRAQAAAGSLGRIAELRLVVPESASKGLATVRVETAGSSSRSTVFLWIK